MLRAELSGNAFLAPAHGLDEEASQSLRMMGWHGNDDVERNWFLECPIGHAPIAAAMVVGALAEVFGIGHPQLLTYDAFGPHSVTAAGLGLEATDEVPAEAAAGPAAPLPLVLMPSDRGSSQRQCRRPFASTSARCQRSTRTATS